MTTDRNCGHPLAIWEWRCTRCALARSIPVDWEILYTTPSRRSKVLDAVKVFGTAFSLILVAWILQAILPLLVSDILLTVGRLIAFVIGIVGLILAGAFVGTLFGSSEYASWSVSKRAIRYLGRLGMSYVENEVPLLDVRRVQVRQGWLDRYFNCGDVEVFGDEAKPKIIISDVVYPHEFKSKLVDILKHRNDKPPADYIVRFTDAVSQARPQEHVATGTPTLRVPVWFAVLVLLAVVNALLFIAGLVVGVLTKPIVAVFLVLALSSLVGGGCLLDALHYSPKARWPLRIVIASYVLVINATCLGLTIYGLVAAADSAVFFSVLSIPAQLLWTWNDQRITPVDWLDMFERRP